MKKFVKKIQNAVAGRLKIIAGLFVLNAGLFIFGASYEWYKSYKMAALFMLGQFLIELVLLFLYYHLKNKKKWKIEKIFLVIALLIGFLHIFITPFNQLPDEITHIFKVNDIANGNLVSKRNDEGHYRSKISSSAYKIINNGQGDSRYYRKVAKQILEPTSDEKWGWNFDTAAHNKPIAYLPQTVGMITGRFLHLPEAMTLYLGRIFALLAYVFIIYFAIKITPKFKEFFMLFALLPMAVQQGMAYSADSLLIAMCFLLVAFAIKGIYGSEKIKGKTVALIYVSVLTLAACKRLAYLPLALILVLIPANKFNKKWQKYLHLALLVIIPVALEIVWRKIQDPAAVAADRSAALIPDNPFKFLLIMLGSFFGYGTWYNTNGIFGMNLGYNSFHAPLEVYNFIMIGLIVVMILRANEKIKMKQLERIVFYLAPIITIVALYFIACYDWKFLGNNGMQIKGIQGRYIIPFLPLIPLLSYYEKKKTEPLSVDYVFLFAIFSNLAILGSKFLHNI